MRHNMAFGSVFNEWTLVISSNTLRNVSTVTNNHFDDTLQFEW